MGPLLAAHWDERGLLLLASSGATFHCHEADGLWPCQDSLGCHVLDGCRFFALLFEFAAVPFWCWCWCLGINLVNTARFCSVNRRVPLILHIKVLSNGYFFHCRTRSWLHCPWDRVPFGVLWPCPVVMVMWPFMLLSPSQRNAP